MELAGDQASPQLPDHLAVLRRRKWSILIVTALAVASVVGVSSRMTPIYTSSAAVLVKPLVSNQFSQTVPTTTLVDLDTEQRIATSSAVAVIAGKKMGAAASPRALLSHVSVNAPTNTQILDISYSDPSPITAQKGSQAFADAYLQFKEDQAIRAYTSARASIQQEISKLQSNLADAEAAAATAKKGSTDETQAQSQISTLTSQIAILENQLGPLNTAQIDPGQVIEPAELPTSPSSPSYPLNVGLALSLGVALGIGLAFLRERLDDSLRGRTDLEEHAGAPVLAVIPKVNNWRRKDKAKLVSWEQPKSSAAEAYRTLRTAVSFLAAQRGVKVIMLASPGAGEGKTTTAANLAVSLSQAGKRVTVVGGDLRKPRIHKFFRIENKLGVVNVLAGEASDRDAIQTVENVRVLPSGPIPSRPAEMLQSDQMGELLDRLRAESDFVLIDSAPALAVADALALAPMVDGVLLVADAEDTHRGAVVAARNQLDQVGAKIFGAVLNDFDPSKAKMGGYYYRYGYGYRYTYAYSNPEGNGGTFAEEPRRIARK